MKGTLSWRQALVGACALSLSAGMVFTAPALADTETVNGSQSYGDIEAGRQGSITLYKHLYQTEEPKITGKVNDSADALKGKNPVKDVVFKAFTFQGLNLTGEGANDNWKKLSELDAEAMKKACAGVTKEAGKPTLAGFEFNEGQLFTATNGDGMTKLSNLAVGAYLICEVEAPKNIVSMAAPFMVTIPYPADIEGNKQWLYDVTAYPKNSSSSLNKTLEDQKKNGYALGDTVEYPISTTVPSIDANDTFDYFVFTDPMDDRFDPDQLTVGEVTLGDTPLTLDNDYVVRVVKKGEDLAPYIGPESTSVATNIAKANTVVVALTGNGLTKLKTNGGKELKFTISGKLTAIGDGTVINKAYLYHKWSPEGGKTPPPPTTPPTPGEPPTPPVETPDVKDKWGDGKIRKYDGDKADGDHVGLQGAKFKVYAAKTPYPVGGECSTEKADDAQPITFAGEDTLTSNAQGVVEIKGLFVSDNVEEHGTGFSDFRCYVLEEIAAPDGYVLPTGGKELTALKITVGKTTENTYDAEVANNKPIIPGLPLTGATGKIVLTASGLFLLAIAAGAVLVFRNRRYAQA